MFTTLHVRMTDLDNVSHLPEVLLIFFLTCLLGIGPQGTLYLF